ncbi:MAG: hypothetical protein HOW73_29920 [Polyangiaceae bacterium]|nr:hypothetical protein [Polyangiaceae bacterium]
MTRHYVLLSIFALSTAVVAAACHIDEPDADDANEDDVATSSDAISPPTYTAQSFSTAPSIDGQLGEYSALSPITLSGASGSAEVRAGWDAQALYVAFDVTDGALLPATGSESSRWNGDGVEVMIDAAFDRSATADQNDYHFVVTSSGVLADSRAWTNYAYTSGATVNAVPRTGGYRVELKIPFASLGITPTAGMQLGFDVAFNDRDVAGGTLNYEDFADLTAFNNPAGWGVLVLDLSPPPANYGTTYYVRTDGGDALQCNGRADAAYPGSGTNKACAWKNPSIALPPSGAARIAGSDTLIIGSGSYEIGSGGYMQPVPSGATATTRTRILGKSCSAPPQLWGTGGIHRVLNLDASSNVEIGCLEITDHSDCVYNHSDSSVKCDSADAWARTGLYARASTNVWLHDLDIHGMGARGLQAGGLTDWTMDRIKLNRNGSAGWDGDVGTGSSSNPGDITIRNIEVGWNGCGERWQTGEPWACSAAYGDGIGVDTSAGDWLIEDAYIHHNTSDGLDLRYMDGADTTHAILRRIYSVANAGNQVKVRGNSLIENSVLVGQCSFFEGIDYMTSANSCRAFGSSLLLVLTGNDVATVRHNTIAGEGDAQIGYTEDGNTTDRIYIQNNVVVGFPDYFHPGSKTLFSGGQAPAVKSFSGNLAWNVQTCPASGTICGQDPKLSNMALETFDGRPLAGSPVFDNAPLISAVIDDFLKKPRPVGAAPDIGAYEVQSP